MGSAEALAMAIHLDHPVYDCLYLVLVGAALANKLKPQLPEDVCHLLKVGSSKRLTISLSWSIWAPAVNY